MTLHRLCLIVLFATFAVFFGAEAYAQCTSPAGANSQTRFTGGKLFYCSGTTWREVPGAAPAAGAGCAVGSVYVPHTAAIDFYSAATHANCNSIKQSRTCTNGVLSGTFTHSSCSAPSCGGVSVGGYCWYFGATDESCTTVCASRGGYNAATLSYAGSGGSNNNCRDVLDGLGIGTIGSSPSTNAFATGCGTSNSLVRHRGTTATTESANGAAVRRACACNN